MSAGRDARLPEGVKDRCEKAQLRAEPRTEPYSQIHARTHAQAHAQPTRARTPARRLCVVGLVAIGLATAGYFGATPTTLSTPGARQALAGTPFTSTSREGDRPYPVGDVVLSVHPRTLEMIEWFDARGLLRSVGFDADGRVDRVICEAVPAAGVTLPDASFRASGIRCNELGEIVEILPASSDDEPCELFVILADPNPRNWIYTCIGPCPAPSACILGIDLATLEIACTCLP